VGPISKTQIPDEYFLLTAKKSHAYRQVHGRLASPFPQDAWTETGFVFYTFDLMPEKSVDEPVAPSATALFVVDEVQNTLLVAKIITPDAAGAEALVQDLAGQDVTSTIPLPPFWGV
jgi:hypothetical protein